MIEIIGKSIDARKNRLLNVDALELHHDFTDDPDGTPVTADSGQPWTLTWSPRIAANPIAASGEYVINDTTATSSAGYLTAQLHARVTFLEGDFAWGSGSTEGGVVGLIAFATNLPSGSLGGLVDTPCHLVPTRSGWIYSVISGGTFTEIASLDYAAPISSQHVEVAIDYLNSTAYVLGADGVITAIFDSRIGSVSGSYACAEIYYSDASTDKRVSISRFGADATLPNAQNAVASRWAALKTMHDEAVGAASSAIIAERSAVRTLTNTSITNPKISGILDFYGNLVGVFNTGSSSAVNYVTFTSEPTGAGPLIVASGGDTNVDLSLFGKGTGRVKAYDGTAVSEVVTLTGTQTLLDKSLSAPKIVNYILDSNGALTLSLPATPSAVNFVVIYNEPTGIGAAIGVDGSDTNIDLLLLPKGTGSVKTLQGGTYAEVVNIAAAQTLSHKNIDNTCVLSPDLEDGWTARDQGWIAWTGDPSLYYGSNVFTPGYMILVGVKIPHGITTVTNIIFEILTAGASLTAGQCKACLYQGGSLLGTTADQSTAWASTGVKTMALGSAATVVPGLAYVGFWANGTTSPALFSAGSMTATNAGSFLRNAYDTSGPYATTTANSTLGTLAAYIDFWAAVS